MSYLTHLLSSLFQNTKTVINTSNVDLVCVRHASKKASASTRIAPGHPRPKHRGWRVQDGAFVQAGTLLATQRTTRFHPGLHVGMGRNGTLFAMEPGKVMVTCEKINPNMEHTWIQKNYPSDRKVIYKKHFNVIPEPQHDRFVVVDKI